MLLRDTLALFAQVLDEPLTANAAGSLLPNIPRTVGKCLSSGCYVASSCFMALAVLLAPAAQARSATSDKARK
ncbi:hypothetical protein AGMMS50256_17820 [Betaproteobacteria bacterium]|nr:hypothetical protein AGMMS50256_17820 [Betaproteobacteria bacterium]